MLQITSTARLYKLVKLWGIIKGMLIAEDALADKLFIVLELELELVFAKYHFLCAYVPFSLVYQLLNATRKEYRHQGSKIRMKSLHNI